MHYWPRAGFCCALSQIQRSVEGHPSFCEDSTQWSRPTRSPDRDREHNMMLCTITYFNIVYSHLHMLLMQTRHYETPTPTGIYMQPECMVLANSSQLIQLVICTHHSTARCGIHKEWFLAFLFALLD